MAGSRSRSVGTVVAEIRMIRILYNGALLVLEGPDDIKFWKTRADVRPSHPRCRLVEAGGKLTVTQALS